jgi:tetratricopeptide (TPR) repeat protein
MSSGNEIFISDSNNDHDVDLVDEEDELIQYERELRSLREEFGNDDLKVAEKLHSIGLVQFKRDLRESALESFQESLRIRDLQLGRDHKMCALSLYNIATLHLEMGDEEEAICHYKETLRVERVSLGEFHPTAMMTLSHIGRVYQQYGKPELAIQCFLQILGWEEQRAEDLEDQNDLLVATTYSDLGNVYLQLGRAKESVEAFSHALRRFKMAGRGQDDLTIRGFGIYSLSKMHPECAALA